MKVNYLVVGAGLTGAVIARLLTDAGEKVLVIDRRPEVGGNVADYFHPSGIHVHRYGPHFFRTISDEVWRFVTRFTTFHDYKHTVKTKVDGNFENWPIALSYIERVCGKAWKESLYRGDCQNFEEAALAMMPRLVYEKFIKCYTEKQWGVSASSLEPDLCRRFDVRVDDNPYLTPNAKYQGIPTEGYSKMVQRMLAGIPVVLNFDYLKDRTAFRATKMTFFTGPIDEFFNYELGKLAYRSQIRINEYYPDKDWLLPCGQVNNPNEGAHIREIEWKHLMAENYKNRIHGTLITKEVPFSPTDPDQYEYPFPDSVNRKLFEAYKEMKKDIPDLIICGRLGEYKYFDMDHAIARAMTIVKKILKHKKPLDTAHI